jgi:hypothetical protein
VNAGFKITDEFSPKCDALPDAAACAIAAVTDSDFVQVCVFNPGDDTEGLGIAREGRTLIRVMASRKG